MTTEPMGIKEFLLARIAEDEAEAKAAEQAVRFGEKPLEVWEWDYFMLNGEAPAQDDAERHILKWWPGRILAECAAKRAIIEDTYWQPEKRPADAELHARARHPAYEYETTEGPRKQWDNPEEPPEGEGWEPNTAKGYRDGWARLEYTEESYWRRLKPEGERREWKPYIPRELRALAAVYSDHPDYQDEWKPEAEEAA